MIELDSDPVKPLIVRISDPVLIHFIERFCEEMQWTPHAFTRDVLYKFFDGLGYGASLTRPPRQ